MTLRRISPMPTYWASDLKNRGITLAAVGLGCTYPQY